jgi:hypothetical protein
VIFDGAGGTGAGATVSLRWAIQQVNLGNYNEIDFDIANLGQVAGVQFNTDLGVLPTITKPVTINGYSQNNGVVTGTP